MKVLKALALTSLLSASTSNAFAYNVVERYTLLDDKIKTEQMLRPFGHDFFLDLGVAMNKNAQTFVKDMSDAGKATDKTTAAQNVLTNYDKTEQTLKINFALGIPVFRFSAWDLKVQPNIRAFADAAANMGINSDTLSISDVLNFIPENIPYKDEFATFVTGLNTGDDIIVECTASGTLRVEIKAFCATQPTGKYKKPDLSSKVPNVQLFAKLDVRAGLYNEYTYGEKFFGNLNLYLLNRTDIYQRISKDMIIAGAKIDLSKKTNTENSLMLDYKFGYQYDNYRVAGSLEELKITTMKKRDTASREMVYGYHALMRVHADATYKFNVITLNPFLGVHKRSGYGFADGLYAGADAGAYVWGDRLGLQLRGMLDKQYLTISPRMKLWLMQLEYSLKSPLKSTDGDVKLSAINSIDFRLFF
jgi:hypothetical protein